MTTSSIKTRLGSCRDRLDELEEQTSQERQRRDALVVQAREDDELSYKQIADAAGISKARVMAILAAN